MLTASLRCDLICSEELRANPKCSRFRTNASALIVAALFEGEIVRRGQRQCKRGMRRSAGQDDTGEQMNLPCRREAEHHAPGPAAKFGFQILASCGSHKGGKTAYRQAKNLPTAFSAAPVDFGPARMLWRNPARTSLQSGHAANRSPP
jgi:hypothetical protein